MGFGERGRKEIPAEAHGDGAGCYLGEASGEDEVGGGGGAGEAGSEGEWDGETVGDAHDDVPYHIARREVLLLVVQQELLCRRRRRGYCHRPTIFKRHSSSSVFLVASSRSLSFATSGTGERERQESGVACLGPVDLSRATDGSWYFPIKISSGTWRPRVPKPKKSGCGTRALFLKKKKASNIFIFLFYFFLTRRKRFFKKNNFSYH